MSAAAADDGEFITLAQIGKPRGVGGEFYIWPLAEDIERFYQLKRVYLVRRKQRVAMEVESFRIVSGKPVIKVRGIDAPEDAHDWATGYLEIDAADRVALPKGTYFQDDLIGLDVEDEDGKHLATLESVMEMPANDVYICRTPAGAEVLVPAVETVVKKIDVKARKMIVYPLLGLFE